MSLRIHVVVNPAAGRDEPVLSVLNREFAAQGVDWTVSVTKDAGDAVRQAREAVESGVDRVAAYGGDGTISSVASSLVGRGVPLAILPGGTGNVVATELGLPPTLEEAVRLAGSPDARETALDVLSIEDRIVLLRVGFGADARMMQRADREQKARLGWLAYLHAAFTEVKEPKTARYRLEIDGRVEELEALTVLVANIGRIGRGGFSFASEIDPTDGRLDVLALRSADLEGFLALGASMLGLKDAEAEEVGPRAPLVHLTGTEVRVESLPAQETQADGDVLGRTPAHVKVLPGAITILRPPPPR